MQNIPGLYEGQEQAPARMVFSVHRIFADYQEFGEARAINVQKYTVSAFPNGLESGKL